jgi:hypothetical protein
MATRSTRLIIKNSDIVNRPLPSSLLGGEGIVNTADGIMYFSGVTTSTNEWTPAGTGTTANFFEVGSNLYDLRLRNRITQYEGISGAGLAGKFLSGTTNGFTLADISSIQGVDSYVTGGTYNQSTDTITLTLNEGKPNVDITGVTDYFTTGATLVGSVAYFDRNDSLSAYTLDLSTFISTGDTYVTAFTYDNANTFTLSRNQGLPDLTASFNTVTGLTVNGTLTANTINGGTILSGGTDLLNIFSQTDIYVTGNTLTPSNNNTPTQSAQLDYNITPAGAPYFIVTENTYVTGGTLNGSTVELDYNDSTITGNTIDLSGLDVNDTFVTAFTYDNANTFTISRNEGQPDLTATINTVTGMTNTGNLDLQGELANSTGNVVINDNLDITGTTTSWGNILPGAHLTYDLGAAGQRWDELWVRKIQIGTTTTTLSEEGGNFEMSGNTGDFVFKPAVNSSFYSDVLPDADLTRDIGAPALRWNVFAGNITATGLTISNLGANRVVYTDGSGALTTEAGFEYDATLDTMTVGNIDVTSDVTINGDLTVLGTSISAFTSELYVEDNNVILNYNPTGNTNVTSVNAGWTIQDGNGVSGDVRYNIVRMQNLSGLTAQDTPDLTEYTSGTGYANRGWATELNDIVIRSTDTTDDGVAGSVTGVRVLAEFDILDGGDY